MYIKKKYRRLLQLADEKFTIPKYFQKFINEKAKMHNLIIKSRGSTCYCTCCKHEFTNTAKVNSILKCPKCKQQLLVKTDRLQRYVFRDNLQLLDKVDNKFLLRTFELYSTYNNNIVRNTVTEFMRTIIDGNNIVDFVTKETHNHFGSIYVNHYQVSTGWKARNLRWAYRDVIGIVCPYNLNKLLQNTDLKYSQLDKFIKKKNDYVDIITYFTKIAHYPSFELLVKLKLYNLAATADKFISGKGFNDVFGVPKGFYMFIKKHDLNYQQLEVLRLIKKEDIKLINKLVHFNRLEKLSRYVDLEKAYYKVLRFNKHREYEYLEYLRMCIQLGYPMKDKKILYPQKLSEEYKKVKQLVKVIENEANDRLIKERLKELDRNTYQDNKYIVFPADSVASLINESNQLNNCVKTYCRTYALGETNLYFMREKAIKDKSLVTVEVSDNNIVQARANRNSAPSDEQLKFLELWQTTVLNKAT